MVWKTVPSSNHRKDKDFCPGSQSRFRVLYRVALRRWRSWTAVLIVPSMISLLFVVNIWVEDQDYNVVRCNGTYGPIRRPAHYFHFDSWRLNMRQGVWLPAYIYSEESHIDMGLVHDLTFKAQTRLWGYNLGTAAKNEELDRKSVV